MEPPAKRSRVGEGYHLPTVVSQVQQQQIPPMQTTASLQASIDSLPIATVKDLLLQAAIRDGAIAGSIVWSVDAMRSAERRRVISFDGYSTDAWHELNTEHAHLSGSRQYEKAGEVENEIEGMLDAILRETKPHSPFGTKKSAAETFRKIYKSVVMAGDTLGREVRKGCFQWDEKFAEVLDRMNDEEKWRLVSEEGGAWHEKFRELVTMSSHHCVFEGLQDVLDELDAMFDGEGEGEGEGEEHADGTGN